MQDYFTEAEYRELTNDNKSPYWVTAEDITRAGTEVVNRLERWARSAWPTIVDPKEAREATERYRLLGGEMMILTRRVPIIEVSELIINDTTYSEADLTAFSASDYLVEYDSGIIRIGDWDRFPRPTAVYPQMVEITYTYGFIETPEEIKAPCILATESRLRKEDSRGRIPRNVTSYSTEKTTFNFMRKSAPDEPWPWDWDASADVQAYWLPSRPVGMMRVG